MASPADKQKGNVPGRFYTDTQCIDCDLCWQTAPGLFSRHPDGGYSIVVKQPANEEEIERCQQAMEECPVEAIGNDGE